MDEEAVEIPIGEELDLHSFRPRDIPDVVASYLDACREQGLRSVRLVHGRGKGVQRAVVQRVLSSRADVADFRDAAPEDGGWDCTSSRTASRSVSKDRICSSSSAAHILGSSGSETPACSGTS